LSGGRSKRSCPCQHVALTRGLWTPSPTKRRLLGNLPSNGCTWVVGCGSARGPSTARLRNGLEGPGPAAGAGIRQRWDESRRRPARHCQQGAPGPPGPWGLGAAHRRPHALAHPNQHLCSYDAGPTLAGTPPRRSRPSHGLAHGPTTAASRSYPSPQSSRRPSVGRSSAPPWLPSLVRSADGSALTSDSWLDETS
jgi:hypothetical protein